MVLVKASLDARHEVLVVILESYYARSGCSNCGALSVAVWSWQRFLRTLGDIDVTARKAVEGSQAGVHVHAVL